MGKRALRIVLEDRPVAYHPILARVMGGVSGGIWLGQILYWDSVKHHGQPNGDGWDGFFYKSEKELIEETALTRRECQSAKSRAKELGIIEVELRRFPSVSHYKVNLERLEELIEAAFQVHAVERKLHTIEQLGAHHRTASSPPSRDQLVHFPSSVSDRLPESTAESTAETTTPGGVVGAEAQGKTRAILSAIKGVSPETARVWTGWIPKALVERPDIRDPLAYAISVLRANLDARPPAAAEKERWYDREGYADLVKR